MIVPYLGKTQNLNFQWIAKIFGAINGYPATINVLGFNTEKPEEFQALLSEDLEKLKKCEQNPNVQNSIKYISSIIGMLSDSVYKKNPDIELLKRIASDFHFNKLEASQVIFLSYISGMTKH